LGVLGYVWLQVQQVRVSYELEGLRTRRAQIDERNRKLALELASLRAFARVDSAARKLGLTEPTPDQVRLARAFVVPESPPGERVARKSPRGEIAFQAASGPEPPTSSRARPSTP